MITHVFEHRVQQQKWKLKYIKNDKWHHHHQHHQQQQQSNWTAKKGKNRRLQLN